MHRSTPESWLVPRVGLELVNSASNNGYILFAGGRFRGLLHASHPIVPCAAIHMQAGTSMANPVFPRGAESGKWHGRCEVSWSRLAVRALELCGGPHVHSFVHAPCQSGHDTIDCLASTIPHDEYWMSRPTLLNGSPSFCRSMPLPRLNTSDWSRPSQRRPTRRF